MIAYLACPIDHCFNDPEFDDRRDGLKHDLSRMGAVVYEPIGAWSLNVDTATPDEMYKLSDINMYALDQADLLVALAPLGVPSVGVPVEVYHSLTTTNAKVALWLGAGDHTRVGAVWNYLMLEYPERVRLLSSSLPTSEIHGLFDWTNNTEGSPVTV